MKKIFIASVMGLVSMTSFAQSGTNSPYSQYGLGVLSEPAGGINRGMNGLGLGFREHNSLNILNPASYSAIDSLSFIFDAGVSGQITNYNESGKKVNANNSSVEYIIAGFRLARHLGLSFGLLPYSNIGYNYSNTQKIGGSNITDETSYTNSYSGDGGLHSVYIGLGWEPFKGFSIGANIAYLWGEYTREVVNSYSDAYINTLSKFYSASVNSYKLDFGVQYTADISKKDKVTIGLTYSPGHKLGTDPRCRVISTNSQTVVADTTTYVVKNGLEIPTMFGVGLMWNRDDKLKVGIDYTLQKWASLKYPVYDVVNNVPQYTSVSGLFNDRHKVTLGGDYCPGETSRKFFNRMHYRFGVSYATPYIKINGEDGPKEYSVSAGFGIPVTNRINNRSVLNISAQWVRQDSKKFITENSFRINIGLTFNERWFAKWKMD
ncbi:MAG: hypothetical protein ACI3YB_06305 [Prevotella sp.]